MKLKTLEQYLASYSREARVGSRLVKLPGIHSAPCLLVLYVSVVLSKTEHEVTYQQNAVLICSPVRVRVSRGSCHGPVVGGEGGEQ